MNISSIRKMVRNYRFEREDKFLNKYCRLDMNLPNDVYNPLATARNGNGLADFARRKGVRIDISDAEQKLAKDVFEFDIDERQAKRISEGKIAITVTQLKPKKKGGVIRSLTTFISKDTKQITNRKVEEPWFGVELAEHEDNFLRNVYLQIENLANLLTGKK